MAALLGFEQYPGKVTGEKVATYGPALGKVGAGGTGKREKPGRSYTVEGKGRF